MFLVDFFVMLLAGSIIVWAVGGFLAVGFSAFTMDFKLTELNSIDFNFEDGLDDISDVSAIFILSWLAFGVELRLMLETLRERKS